MTTHHEYWKSIAKMPYSTKQNPLKPMNPLQAIAPLLNQINTLKNENTQPKPQTESLVDLNKELVEALKESKSAYYEIMHKASNAIDRINIAIEKAE